MWAQIRLPVMASQICHFCAAPMDSRDGHRECPGCLGRAHLLEDVKNPCPAALDLPLEERARRAGLQTVPVSLMGSSSTHEKQPHVSAMSSKRKLKQPHKSSHKHKRRRASQDSPSTSTHPPSSPVQDSVGEDLHVQLLAAIRGLTDRVAT